jgi:dolichol kinase
MFLRVDRLSWIGEDIREMKALLLKKIPNLFLLVVPFGYFYLSNQVMQYWLRILLLALIIFESSCFLNQSFRKRAERIVLLGIAPEGNRLSKISFLFLGVFVVVNYFERRIAIISLLIALTYNFLSLFALCWQKMRIKGKSLPGIIVALLVAFILGYYAGNILTLDKNIIFSAILIPAIAEFFLNWPDENFTIPFLTALVAQFVKNSF